MTGFTEYLPYFFRSHQKITAVSILPYNFSNLSQLSQPGKASKPHSMNSPDNNLPGLFISRLLKKYNFVIANGVKQSLVKTAKLVLNLF